MSFQNQNQIPLQNQNIAQQNNPYQPSWQKRTRKIHIRNIIIIMFVLILVIGVVVFGLTYPACNPTQVRGFFKCNCKPNSVYDSSLKACVCENNGTQLGIACDDDSSDQRYVFSAETDFKGDDISQTAKNWVFTQADLPPDPS
jgi:hypothetical protein